MSVKSDGSSIDLRFATIFTYYVSTLRVLVIINGVNIFEERWTVYIMDNVWDSNSNSYFYPVPHCLTHSPRLYSFPRPM